MDGIQGNKSAKRASVPRKKACRPCTVARARCDLIRPTCSRCVDKQLQCEYFVPAAAGARVRRRPEATLLASSAGSTSPSFDPLALTAPEVVLSPTTHNSSLLGTSERTTAVLSCPSDIGDPRPSTSAPSKDTALFDDTDAVLLAPLDVSRIRDRWLDYYFTPTTKQIKEYPARIMALMSRTLSTYPAMWIRNQSHTPPFLHPAQCSQQTIMPETLANCLSLLRLCANAVPGSDDLVRDNVQREMSRLVSVIEEGVHGRTLSHHLSCLSALQAYLLLSIHTYFASKAQPSLGIFSPALIATLHDLASKVSAAGIMSPEEVGGAVLAASSVPRWETWIIAEAKRRTVFCVYMFEDVYNYESSASTYLAEELAALLAPASKWTWRASSRSSFDAEYLGWARAWSGERGLVISELWPREPGGGACTDDADDARRKQETQERISRWAETVDEFGMFLLAVCTTTHNV